jgi:L-ascorbate metabolism protein UlaG (beta-lactamase superfamily)
LSHAHTDHIDPYTLVSLFKNLKKKPKILLPETVIILKSLLEKYLNNPEIIILSSKQTIEIRGIKIT